MRPKVYNRINSDGERVFYYLCELKEKSKKKRCDIPNVNGNNIDKSVINELKKIAAKNSPVFSEVFDKKTLVRNERDTLQAEIDSLKTKIEEADLGIDNLVTAIARGQKDEVLTTIFDKMEVLTNQKKTFEKKLAELQDVEKVAEFNGINLDFVVQTLGNFNNSSWELMDVESKRNMIKSIVDKIIWDGKKVDMLLFGSKILEMSEIEPPKQINTENSAEMLPQCEGRK
jgi:site-specific DNA recombinase